MLYSDHPRVHYDNPQLAEVICQLRFPTILAIGAREPVDFQEAVRTQFPRFAAKEERPAPKLAGLGTPEVRMEEQKPVINYSFISADGRWRLNLTSGFISLSTVAYPGWEEFAGMLLDLASLVRPSVTLVDGVTAMEGDGPAGGDPRALGYTFASRDIYTLDWFLAERVMGIPPDGVPMLRQARERGLVEEAPLLTGDPLGEIAAGQGFTESKVKSMLYRTRIGLKKYLEKEGFFDEM